MSTQTKTKVRPLASFFPTLYSPPRVAVLRIRICQIRVQYFHGLALARFLIHILWKWSRSWFSCWQIQLRKVIYSKYKKSLFGFRRTFLLYGLFKKCVILVIPPIESDIWTTVFWPYAISMQLICPKDCILPVKKKLKCPYVCGFLQTIIEMAHW